MRRKTELVKDCFAVFMVALIQLLSQSYEETHAGCAPLHMLRLYMLHPRDWVCDVKLDSAETLQGGFCSTRFRSGFGSDLDAFITCTCLACGVWPRRVLLWTESSLVWMEVSVCERCHVTICNRCLKRNSCECSLLPVASKYSCRTGATTIDTPKASKKL